MMTSAPNNSKNVSAAQVINNSQTLVVKLGSSLLVDEQRQTVNRDWLATVVQDLAELKTLDKNIIIVSSGAIALGCLTMGFVRSQLRLADIQAAAAIGQIALAQEFSSALAAHDLVAAQVLLTLDDTEQRKRYLNARETLNSLLKNKVIPIINENDTVATSEIRFGDNDRLAARVAQMMSADCLLLLSDVDGLYAEDPRVNPAANLLESVHLITDEIEAMAGASQSKFGTGGMTTKLMAAKLAVNSGCHCVLASGTWPHPVKRVRDNAPCTLFVSTASPVAKRKQWIAGSLQTCGDITIDEGAVQALAKGGSLLPVGLVAISGQFERGDAVRILDQQGGEVGRGLSNYSRLEADQISGMKSAEIERVLGYPGAMEIIHRDDLALGRSAGAG